MNRKLMLVGILAMVVLAGCGGPGVESPTDGTPAVTDGEQTDTAMGDGTPTPTEAGDGTTAPPDTSVDAGTDAS